DLKTALEQGPMTGSDFVYTTYIKTTPERLWQALTDPALTRRYWGVAFVTDWKPGSTITWHEESASIVDAEQVVLEAEPGRRLSYTWHTFTPEWAEAVGLAGGPRPRPPAAPRAKGTIQPDPPGA